MKPFVLRIAISLILGFIFVFFISKFTGLSAAEWEGITAGAILALFYVGSGFVFFALARRMSQKDFNRVFVMSLAGRFLLVFAGIALVYKWNLVSVEIFIISFFVWYFVFQIFEVLSLNQLFRKKV